ncbi:hypothetical protein HSIEG1_1240 [Enterococcus sp. HSIEG1]|nr:hypothetical protein HSIEG1_1240 [Enterococcus sp. HSIEG1]
MQRDVRILHPDFFPVILPKSSKIFGMLVEMKSRIQKEIA